MFLKWGVHSHDDDPLSLERSIQRFWSRLSWLYTLWACSSCFLQFLVLTWLLIVFVVLQSTVAVVPWEMIKAASGAVMFSDEVKLSEAMVEGLWMPKPPRRMGSASRSLSTEEQGGHPVKAGMKCWCSASSNGCSRSAISGTVLSKYDQWLDRSWI